MCISQTFGDFGISKVSDCNIVLIKVFFSSSENEPDTFFGWMCYVENRVIYIIT